MTFAKKSGKKVWKNKPSAVSHKPSAINLRPSAKSLCLYFIFLAIITFLCLHPFPSHAETGIKQFQRQLMIGGRLHSVILIIGYANDKEKIETLFDFVNQKANESFARLDSQNPNSELSKINTAAGQAAVTVPDDVVEAFKTAQQISNLTDGAFDIIYGNSGHYRDVSIGANSVQLQKAGMQARFDSMLDGFLAELMIRYIYAATMQNAMVKVENTFRGIGQNVMGPWKIQVQDDEGTFAHHALNLSVSNTGIATVSANQYRSQPLVDPRTNSQVQQPCRGVTVIMADAAQAQGIANAIYLLGPDQGQKLLAKLGNIKALIVDNEGKFIRTAGF